MINKNKYQVNKDKKVLHKIGKQWKVVSVALLMAIGGGALITHHANADTIPTQHNITQQSKPTVTSQVSAVHTQAVAQNNSQVSQPSYHAPSVASSAVQSAPSQNIENRAQVLHTQIASQPVQSNQNRNIIPEDKPVNKTADNTINFSNHTGFTPFHFANHNSAVQQKVNQRNEWNFARFGATSTKSDEDYTPIQGAYYSPKDDKFHVGTKPLDNDIVKSYGGLEHLDYTETNKYNPNNYKSDATTTINFTDGTMPNNFTLDQYSTTLMNGKTMDGIPSDVVNADKIIFSSDIDTSQVQHKADMRNYLLSRGAVLPFDFLSQRPQEKHESYTPEVDLTENALHQAESNNATINSSADIAKTMVQQASSVALSASDYDNASEIDRISADDANGYSNILNDSSQALSNYNQISEDANNNVKASLANDGQSINFNLNNAETLNNQIGFELSDLNDNFSHMAFATRGNHKVIDNIIFNGDPSADYVVHGFNTHHKSISAPNGYHFIDNEPSKDIILNNGKHTFNVFKDIDFNQIETNLGSAQSNLKDLNNIISKANQMNETQSKNALNANQYLNADQLINASSKDTNVANQLGKLLDNVNADYNSAKNYINDLHDHNDQTAISNDLNQINNKETDIKNNLNQASQTLHNMTIVNKGNKKVQRILVSYRYNGYVLKHYSMTGDARESYSNNVPQGYYIKDTHKYTDGIIVDLGHHGPINPNSNIAIPIVPASSTASSSAKSNVAPSSVASSKASSSVSSASIKPMSNSVQSVSSNSSSISTDDTSVVAPVSSSVSSSAISVAPQVNMASSSASQSDSSDDSLSLEEDQLQIQIDKLKLKVIELTEELEQMPAVNTEAVSKPRAKKHIRRHKRVPFVKVNQITHQEIEELPTKVHSIQIKRNVLLHTDAFSVGSNHKVVGRLPKIKNHIRVIGLYKIGNSYRYEIKINGHIYFITANKSFVQIIK